MGSKYRLFLSLGVCLLLRCDFARSSPEVSNDFPREPRAYQPPLGLGHPVPAPSQQSSYQPPISLIRSNEYQSPLSPRSPQPQPYVLPQQQSQSVQYVPPSQHSYSVYQKPQPATSYSVQQQSPQSVALLGDPSHSTAERTYSVHPKGVESHVPAQAIHKAPASEISPDKSSGAKDKDNLKDEYVVYYYYYYDNDTSANNNLSLNFDDIPSLEGYDGDKLPKEPEKGARALPADINLLTPDSDKTQTQTGASQPRAVGDAYGRPERPGNAPLDSTSVQNMKPVSNVFRYGSNEVPRFPVLPNFIVTEVQTTMRPPPSTPESLPTHAPTTQSSSSVQKNAQPDLKTGDEVDDDDLNNVLANDLRAFDEKAVEEEQTTPTPTTTTAEPTTTTEEPTTTTEKPRRRPSLGGRRRFNSNPSSSFSPNRNRQAPSRSTTSTSTSASTSSTSTSTAATPTRRSFGSNRIRPRPAIGSNRPRPGARTTEASEDRAESRAPEPTPSSTAAPRSRFTSAAPRRFQSSRSRSQGASSSSTTSTTTRAPPSVSRSRPTSRPRPNLITRNRPPRPGFLRPRPGSEPEEAETTTVAPPPTEGAAPEAVDEDLPSTDDESNETDEDNETSEETDEPTTTEGSRFSALFRPRNRNALGNRPRPVIGNRPSRT